MSVSLVPTSRKIIRETGRTWEKIKGFCSLYVRDSSGHPFALLLDSILSHARMSEGLELWVISVS